MNKELKPWDYVNSILRKNEYIEPNNKYSQFVINRYFASDISYVLIANYINKNYPYITNKMHYDFYYYIIQKTSKKLFYPKFSEKKEKNIQYIMKYFKINKEEAEMYFKNISKDDLKKIKKEVQKQETNK